MLAPSRVCVPSQELAHLTQLQQWLIWWEVELGRSAPPKLFDGEMRARTARALAQGDEVAGGHRVSALQRDVGRCLERLRLAYTSEHITPEGYSMDMRVQLGGGAYSVALEVDGPHHFSHDGAESGATRLKRRQLTRLGWRCVNVGYQEWYALQRDAAREDEYLRRKLMLPAPTGNQHRRF